ncbi:MAG: alpha/beta hydrolase [Aurantibacter sp.]
MKWAGRLLRTIVITVIAVVAMLYFFQEKLIFHSNEISPDYVYQFASPFEELFLTAEDGAVLNGLHFKQRRPKGVIFYCHGNAGELDDWGNWAQELSNRYQYDVVIWDYRGYGKSTGKRRQNLMLDDGFLFYEYCKKQFREEDITVFGRSLGGFFATHVTKDSNPGKLVLESTPTSLLHIAEKEYPLLPSRQLLKFRFQSDQNVPKIKIPTFFIHGTEDALIPFEHGKQLYDLSGAKMKKFYRVDGGDHNDLARFDESYFGALDEILAGL